MHVTYPENFTAIMDVVKFSPKISMPLHFCSLLLSWLVSDVQKLSWLGLEPRADFRGCGLFSVTPRWNKVAVVVILLSSLVSEVQALPTTDFELKTVFRSFYFNIYFCGLKEKVCQFWFRSVYPLYQQCKSEHIHTHTQNLNCIHEISSKVLLGER